MIARLLDSVRALAGATPADADAADLAAEFADAFLLASDCRQLLLSADQMEALGRLDRMLAEREPLAAIDDDVRGVAKRALATLQ